MAKAQLFVVNFGSSQTGLSTVGYTIYRTNGTTYQARSTSGVVEYGSSGIYGAMVERPDEDVVVLWDTGSGKYGAEDSRVMIDGISNETDKIKMIWNSIKNQGEFMAVLMDKLGLIEKNLGMTSQISKDDVKSIVSESVSKIKFPEVKIPEIKIPEPKDIKIPEPVRYESKFMELSSMISDLSKKVSMIKPEKTDITPVLDNLKSAAEEIKNMVQSIKIPDPKDYSGNFKGLESMLDSFNSKLSGDMSNRFGSVKSDISRVTSYFAKLDSLLSMMGDVINQNKNMVLDDKQRDIGVKQEIQRILSEVNRLNQAYANYMNSDKGKDLLFMLGHRMK